MSRNGKKCEMVRDMLPAIRDLSASAASREFVSRHLVTCRDCREYAEAMMLETKQKGLVRETAALESLLPTDRELRYGLTPRSPAFVIAAASMSAALTLGTIACLVVDRMLSGGITWSVIVAAACFFAASVLVTPFAVRRYRIAKTAGFFAVGLFVLLFVINRYTGGHWFAVAYTGAIFVLSAVFLPIILMTLPATEDRGRFAGFITIAWESIWLVLLIIAVGRFLGQYGYSQAYYQRALPYTAMALVLAWGEYALAGFVPGKGLSKVSACVALGGVFCLAMYRFLDKEDRVLLGRPIFLFALFLLAIALFLYALARWQERQRGKREETGVTGPDIR